MWNFRSRRLRIGIAVGLIIFLLSGSALFQFVATQLERREFPPVGRLVDAGGYRLHLYCIGAGSRAVIFESGSE